MSRYNIDKSFGAAAGFRVPLNRAIARASGLYLKNAARCLRSREDVAVKTEKIAVQGGAIDLHIITPRGCGGQNPCLFYIHGGGFAYDAQPHQFKNAADYAAGTGSVVVFPRYRLTPKFSAPVLLEDCAAAWRWTVANATGCKIDPARIGVGGDSAGGYLAARLTNQLVGSGEAVRYQLLIYPVIDSAMRTQSMRRYTDTPMWDAKNNRIMWRWYYGGGEPEPALPDEALPRGIPPAYIETAEFDCLHDEGLLYADRLRQAGASVTVYETRGTMHGFDCVKCEITEKAMASRLRFIKERLAGDAESV